MAFYAVQAGTSLQIVKTDGTVFQTLSLPAGVTVSSSIVGHWATLAQQLFFFTASTISLWIDPVTFTVRPMHTVPPIAAPDLAAGSSTGLTGTYRVKVSYITKNDDGLLLNESPLAGPSASVVLANKSLAISDIPIPPTGQGITGRRLYRTVAGGAVYFQLLDIDDVSTTSIDDATTDAALSLLPSDPTLGIIAGSMPGTAMSLVTNWKSRLWGRTSIYDERDDIRYTEEDQFYAWSTENNLPAHPRGEDSFGITGFIPRRDELGVCKRGRILKVTGDSNQDFQVIIVAEGVGCIAPESIVVIRDVGYFLGIDGVYTFGPDGITPISRDKVAPWFLTDTYFDRSYFSQAFAGYNYQNDSYDLFLVPAGGSTFTRWVSFDIRRGEWTGPHLTSSFTPTARGTLSAASGAQRPAFGSSSGFLYDMNQSGASDDGTAIAIDWVTKFFNANAPDIHHYWGMPSIHSKIQAAGTLVVTPRVGDIDASNGTAKNVDMTKARNRLSRLGTGKLCRLEFTHSTNAQDVEIYGFEIPFHEVGRR